jgi:hypothetical protein
VTWLESPGGPDHRQAEALRSHEQTGRAVAIEASQIQEQVVVDVPPS